MGGYTIVCGTMNFTAGSGITIGWVCGWQITGDTPAKDDWHRSFSLSSVSIKRNWESFSSTAYKQRVIRLGDEIWYASKNNEYTDK